jgi:catechol 2,3-dioxygenase-like lactoylglutathione lyase family enzyme
MPSPKLRVARPTDNLEAIIRFYEDGLGLAYIGGFTDHDGFDGVMLGDRFGPYHFEFTHSAHPAGRSPSQDNLLVFYLPDEELWRSSVTRMKNCGYQPVPSFNPYWDRHGVTFEDPDGYRVVLQNGDWPVST